MTQREEIEQLAKDRPTRLDDDLYQWAVDAEEMLWKLAAQPAQPMPPPECKTDAEETAFAFGWWKALETAQTAQIPDNPCLNDYVNKAIRAHMAKLEANGYGLVYTAPPDTEALRKELDEVKTSLRLCVNRLRFVESREAKV